MDPYVQITFNGKVRKTKVIEEGGKNPQWNEKFVIDVSNYNCDIVF